MQTRRLICLDQVLLFTATILATLFGVAPLPCYAQQEKATTSTSGEDVESQPAIKKALKYHKVLTKRPNPGYLFDRFYDAWLEASSSEALGDYLKSQVETMRLAWLTRRETIHPSIKRSDKMSPFSTFCACKGSLG